MRRILPLIIFIITAFFINTVLIAQDNSGGITKSMLEKIQRQFPSTPVGYFCRDWIAPVAKNRLNNPVNDVSLLKGDDLLIVNGRLICNDYKLPESGPSQMVVSGENVVYVRLEQKDVPQDCSTIEALIEKVKTQIKSVEENDAPLANYSWDVMLKNPEGLIADFKNAGKYGIEGTVEQPNAIRGSKENVYIATGAQVHPFVCIDASEGPVYIDRDAEIHPYTRIEGPAYIGPKSILLGTKLREGCTIGPVCRVGGEVEESIIHGYSNKYHDGFLGHAYVGEWVNLGALTTNSDLKNDYSIIVVVKEEQEFYHHILATIVVEVQTSLPGGIIAFGVLAECPFRVASLVIPVIYEPVPTESTIGGDEHQIIVVKISVAVALIIESISVNPIGDRAEEIIGKMNRGSYHCISRIVVVLSEHRIGSLISLSIGHNRQRRSEGHIDGVHFGGVVIGILQEIRC